MVYGACSRLMLLHLHPQAVERARPLLGTLVSIRVTGYEGARAHEAIDAAFEEIALVHRLMSFHEAKSDVSRLNQEAASRPVAVHAYTLEVLRAALDISERSKGCFDISVASQLVEWGLLPQPGERFPHSEGSWRDIELLGNDKVRFHRPLWVDLGGIAKGYAVDRATERLHQCGAMKACVNAGGDLRIQGPATEWVQLRPESISDKMMPVIELANSSVASSSGHLARKWHEGRICGPHVHGLRRDPMSTSRFACVIAAHCITADALTKVVLAEGRQSRKLLEHFGAAAHFHDPHDGWCSISAEA